MYRGYHEVVAGEEFNRFIGLLVERIHKARRETLRPEVVPGEF
jgi:hypothetical protein